MFDTQEKTILLSNEIKVVFSKLNVLKRLNSPPMYWFGISKKMLNKFYKLLIIFNFTLN